MDDSAKDEMKLEIARKTQQALIDITQSHSVAVGDVTLEITNTMFDLAEMGVPRPEAAIRAIREIRTKYGLPAERPD